MGGQCKVGNVNRNIQWFSTTNKKNMGHHPKKYHKQVLYITSQILFLCKKVQI